ncbi:MAG: helix-turn-helix domain-containing protein [Candidatus Altarchaeum sp.]|nr:helix-turn-helix domain-containing protein [Candidatus Altarchaeum sp.]
MQISKLHSLIHSGKFCKDDVMKCIFGLNDVEVKIFCAIVEKDSDVIDLTKKIKKDRATVQRAIKNLVALEIVGRKGLNMKRGRKYVYFAITNETLKKILMARIGEYCKSLKKMVNLIK